jgi:hypothetical protein
MHLKNQLSKRLSRSLAFLDNYWFYPAPLFNLALCRIIFVGFQLGYLLIKDYRTEVLTRSEVPSLTYSPLPVLQLLNYIFPWDAPPVSFLETVFWLSAGFGALALVGLKTNFSLLIFAIGNIYLQSYLYSFGSFHHPQAIMLVALLLLALSPSGKLLSVDSFNNKVFDKKLGKNSSSDNYKQINILQASSPFARWPLLLIQWLFGLAYLSAALNKLVLDGPGLFTLDWMNGYTLQYYLIRDGLLWGSNLGIWIGQQHSLILIFSIVAILFEATFCLTLVFPKLVWLYIPTGALFHIGIYMAQRAPFFQYLALYAAFIPWTAVIKMVRYRLKKTNIAAEHTDTSARW